MYMLASRYFKGEMMDNPQDIIKAYVDNLLKSKNMHL